MHPAVEARDLRLHFGHVVALDGVDLSVAQGEFFSLLGPSGCGKTSFLRVVAGLEHPESGVLLLDGQPTRHLPAHRRSVNTVFQAYALFPHLRVRDNVAFGLRMKRVPEPDLSRRVQSALELTRIESLADRWPAQLSGGQKQRVALARALVNEPNVLLLDEPLAALDLQLRRDLRSELRTLQRRTGITFLLVTHDQEEALALSDRIAVMHHGKIQQCGSGADLYQSPRNRFVAAFLGACNLIPGRLTLPLPIPTLADSRAHLHHSADFGPAFLADFGPLHLGPASFPLSALPASPRPATLAIRPEHVDLFPASARGSGPDLSPHPNPRLNQFPAVIRDRTYSGAETEYTLDLGGHSLRSRRPNPPDAAPAFQTGDPVLVQFPPAALRLLED